MNTTNSMSYSGRKALLTGKLDRELSVEEQGCISGYEVLPEKYMAEARQLANISAVFAIAYLQYIMVPHLADSASMFVYEVLKGGADLDIWIRKKKLNQT